MAPVKKPKANLKEVSTIKRGRKPNKIPEIEPEKTKKIKKNTENLEKTETNVEDVLAKITQDAEEVLEQEKIEEELLPKKKGRKPKNKIFDYKPDEEPKKRGRKPKEKFGIGINEPTIKEEPVKAKKSEDYIILNLPIKSKDLDDVEFTGDKLLNYNEEIQPDPKSYSPNLAYEELELELEPGLESDKDVVTLNNINNLPPSAINPLETNITKIIKEKPNPVDYTKQDLQRRFENIKERKTSLYDSAHNRHMRLMTQFHESGKRNEWPQSTKIYCFWCCHSFDCIPWGIPVKYSNEIFHVSGNYCSPECAAAHNFEKKEYNMWERYMLLNLAYNKVNYPNYRKLNLALPRELLVEYGGNMSIDEYRTYCKNYSKDYIINFPPMVSIPTMAEEVNLSEHFRQKVVFMDQKRIDEASRRCQEQEKELMEHGESLHNCFKRIANLG